MAFCGICGAQMEENAKFCPKCGAPAGSTAPVPPVQPVQPAAPAAAQNTLMGVLSYLSFLCLVPLFTAKNDPYVRFHVGQGLTLFLAEVVVGVIHRVLWNLLPYGLLWRMVNYAYGLVSLGLLVLAVLGIVSAVQGTQKKLPLLGGIVFIK